MKDRPLKEGYNPPPDTHKPPPPPAPPLVPGRIKGIEIPLVVNCPISVECPLMKGKCDVR